MPRRCITAVLPALLVAVVLALACADENDRPAAGSSVSSGSPPPTTASPTPSGTPIPELPGVAAVIQAVEARDVNALAALVRYTPMPCIAAPQGGGAPPLCSAAGALPGSTVETLPALLCEGEYLLRPVVPAFLQQQLERGGYVAHGVLRVDAPPYAFPPDFPATSSWPRPDVAAVFRATRAGLDLGFYLAGGRVVGLRSFGTCGPPLPSAGDPVWRVPPHP